MIKAKINGNDIVVEQGLTIMQAARQYGIHIPYLCDVPFLKPIGACRICLVEIEGVQSLLPACTTAIADGMDIFTHSENVKAARRSVVEMLLTRHPLDCVSCACNGACQLQTLAHELDLENSPFTRLASSSLQAFDDSNPYYVRDLSKCILCGRCIRACHEKAQLHAMNEHIHGIYNTGQSPFGRQLEDADCISCGHCVQACPVGALTEKTSAVKERQWEFKSVISTCPFCGVGCEVLINVDMKSGKIANVTTIQENTTSVNKGRCCVQGRFKWTEIYSGRRIMKPLLRDERGKLRTVEYEEAYDFIANALKKMIDDNGADALGFASSSHCTNESNFAFVRFAREIAGSRNIDFYVPASGTGAKEFGRYKMTRKYSDIYETDLILVTDSNITETHPVIGSFIREHVRDKDGGAKLIVCDIRDGNLADDADMYVRPVEDTKAVLFNGVMQVIISEKLYDEGFAATPQFDELRRELEPFSLDNVEKTSGISKEKIIEIAHEYAAARNPMAFMTGIEFTHGVIGDGVDCADALMSLAALCGKAGSSCVLKMQCNEQGAYDVGCVPPEGGMSTLQMMWATARHELRGLVIMGDDPITTSVDSDYMRYLLSRLDLLVVLDNALTETAKMATVVLPSTGWAEMDGTITNTEGDIQCVRKAIELPDPGLKTNWRIMSDLAERFGAKWNYVNTEDVYDDIVKQVPSYGRFDFRKNCLGK